MTVKMVCQGVTTACMNGPCFDDHTTRRWCQLRNKMVRYKKQEVDNSVRVL